MKKLLLTFFMVLILMIGLTGLASAQGYTAKSLGMGGAFTAVANDVSAVFYNPAGINQSGFVGLQGSAGITTPSISKFKDLLELVDNVEDEEIEPVNLYDQFPESVTVNGMGFAGANLKSLALTGRLNNNFEVNKENDAAVMNNESVKEGVLTFGQDLVNPPLDIGALAYGFNLKMSSFQYNEYTVENVSDVTPIKRVISAEDTGYGVDVGVLAKITDVFSVGAQMKNIIATDYSPVGTEKTYEFSGEWTKVDENDWDNYSQDNSYNDRTMRVGAALKIPVVGTTIAADIDNIPPLTEGEKDMIYHLGVEQNILFNALSLRGGTYGNLKDENQDRTYTVGIGLNLIKFHLSAAAASKDMFEDDITTVLSGGFKF